jgi:hypothetical protein
MAGTAQFRQPASRETTAALDFGLGVGFADLSDTTAGLDIILGMQNKASDGVWHYGGNVHVLSGSDFESIGVYATARPENTWASFLQFQGGVIYANHNYAYQLPQNRWSGGGFAAGVALVGNIGDSIQMHIFDIQHGVVAGHGFTIYSFNVLVPIGALGHK